MLPASMKQNPAELLAFARERKAVFLWPTGLFFAAALLYALVRPATWSASQALQVRDESIGSLTHGGRFESTDAMQTAQETVLEMARHPELLGKVLAELGPPVQRRQANWPTARDVEKFRRNVRIDSPSGAQFGRTEMIYLTVKGPTPERSVAATAAVTRQLVAGMMRLRATRYRSIVQELQNAVEVARKESELAAANLERMETEIGADLPELRVLMDQGQGEGNVRRTLAEIEAELRLATQGLQQQQDLHRQLVQAARSPERLISLPSGALDSQPTLKRLREGLVDAQLATARILGVKSRQHPDAQSAVKAERLIRAQLVQELGRAISSVEADAHTAERRVRDLQTQQNLFTARLDDLASLRTRYSNLAQEVRQKAAVLESVEADLAMAQSQQLSAASVSLIQPINQPVASTRPLGPSRKALVLGGTLAGLLTGGGLLFLLLPVDSPCDPGPAPDEARRLSDRLAHGVRWGRRAYDRWMPRWGRRITDLPPLAATGYWDRRRPQDESIRVPDERRSLDRRVADRHAEDSAEMPESTSRPA